MSREETKSTKGPALCCPLEATRWMLGIARGCVLPSCHAFFFFSLELTPPRWHRASPFRRLLFSSGRKEACRRAFRCLSAFRSSFGSASVAGAKDPATRSGAGHHDLGGTCVKAHGELELSTRASGRPSGNAPTSVVHLSISAGKASILFFLKEAVFFPF